MAWYASRKRPQQLSLWNEGAGRVEFDAVGVKGCFVRFVYGSQGWKGDGEMVVGSQEIALGYATAFLGQDEQAEFIDRGCLGGVSLMKLFFSG